MTAQQQGPKSGPGRSQQPGPLKILLITALVVGPLVGGVLLWRAMSGGTLGEDCTTSGMCALGYSCVQTICTQECEADSDCPGGWSCQDMQIVGRRLGFEYDAGETRMCWRGLDLHLDLPAFVPPSMPTPAPLPAPAAPKPGPSPAPGGK